LAIYRLIAGKYQLLAGDNHHIWLPEIQLGLGYDLGKHIGW